MTILDTIQSLPTHLDIAKTQIETFFEWIHPIIPILNKDSIMHKLSNFYNTTNDNHIYKLEKFIETQNNSINLNILLDLILIFAIFFCSAYSTVAADIIPDLLLCDKYYSAYKFLLNLIEFPYKSYLELIQSFLLVNFILDPNMVESTNWSPILIRMAQQLGLHNLSPLTTTENNNHNIFTIEFNQKRKLNHNLRKIENKTILWHFLLYIEGSSSVVSGFPFMINERLMYSVPIPNCLHLTHGENYYPMEFTIGRFKINYLFYSIMNLTTNDNLIDSDHQRLMERVNELYLDINKLIHCMEQNNSNYNNVTYFTTTLKIFLYRLHLRFLALENLQQKNNKIDGKNGKLLKYYHNNINILNNNDDDDDDDGDSTTIGKKNRDITWLLRTTQNIKFNVIPISLLLLLFTLKRLIQPNIINFAWYTRGSTVMQYLFIILRDLYQNPTRSYSINEFPEIVRATIDSDILEIINCDPINYKFILIEELLRLMELKLAPLWQNNDLYKFLLVKTVKDKVWNTINEPINSFERNNKSTLQKCKIFNESLQLITNLSGINLEDYLSQWDKSKDNKGKDTEQGNDTDNLFTAEQILMDWIAEFH